jgi:hypothetical protein
MNSILPGIPVGPDYSLVFQVIINAEYPIQCLIKASYIIDGKLSHTIYQIRALSYPIAPQLFYLNLPECILIGASIESMNTFDLDYTCYCNISLGQILGGVRNNIFNLSKGHFRNEQPLTWPVQSSSYNDIEACRYVSFQLLPPVGVLPVFACPPYSYMSIVSIHTTLVTNNVVKNRTVYCRIRKSNTTVGQTWASAAQPQSTTTDYDFSIATSISSVPVALRHFIPLIPHRLIGFDDDVRILCLNFDAGDQFSPAAAMAKIYSLPFS